MSAIISPCLSPPQAAALTQLAEDRRATAREILMELPDPKDKALARLQIQIATALATDADGISALLAVARRCPSKPNPPKDRP